MKLIIYIIVASLSINYSMANNNIYLKYIQNSTQNCFQNHNTNNCYTNYYTSNDCIQNNCTKNCHKNCDNNCNNIIFSNTDINIYKNIIKDYATNNSNINNTKPLSQILINIAKQRLNTPYVAGTIDKNPDTENLIINLHETDCILFVESCLALALTAKSNDTSITNFINYIKKLRYREGIVDGYTGRIHYTSEWILQGEANKFFKDISKELSGIPINNPISFISNHSDKYEHLKKYPADIQKIKEIETNINTNTFYYIPKNKVPNIINKLKNGDIVCFNTSIKGLDISHVGIIYINNGITTFIHASLSAKKTIIEKKSLIEYINSIKSNNGIRILRPL